jgi:hypothetical protein
LKQAYDKLHLSRRLNKEISSFEGMFEGIALVLNPGKTTAK